jgi:hypothetical protein
MRIFSYAFKKLTCKCAKRSGGKTRDEKLWVGLFLSFLFNVWWAKIKSFFGSVCVSPFLKSVDMFIGQN